MARTDANPPMMPFTDEYALVEVDADYLTRAVKPKQFIHIDQSECIMCEGCVDIVRAPFHRWWICIGGFRHDPWRNDRERRSNSMDVVDSSDAGHRRCRWCVRIDESFLVTTP